MKYKITFRTGLVSGAGTDAKVSLKLFGSKANSGDITLDSKISQFEKGDIDTFLLETEDLGKIEKITIWHNNKFLGADWFLENITIDVQNRTKSWYFPVHKWIKDNTKHRIKSVPYSIFNFEITTGTLPGSGSNENIYFSLIGSKTYTHFVALKPYLKEKEFKTGHTEVFSILLEDVGKIEEIKLKTSISAFNSSWFLSKLKVKKETDKNYISFPFHSWIKPGKIYSSSKNLKEYTIKFFTGDVAAGGTDANVKMIIYGTRGETTPININELIARDAFEKGKIDYIKFAHRNLGSIKKIKIWHDEKWLGDGWFLNKILIKNDETGIEAEFPYFSWLDKSADPKSSNIELTKMPIQPRPFYAIAHMVNTPAYVEEALVLGSNSIEFDITPKLDKWGNFEFDVFHGFRPDFDLDKINLMERSIARTKFPEFLKSLKIFEEKFQNLTLAIYDCKLGDVPKIKLELCGIQLAEEVIKNFYGSDDTNRIFTIFSVGKKHTSPFFDGVMKTIPKDFLKYIGFDFSEESFQTTEKIFEQRKETNFWWGSGIASTVPKPLKHFIPQFLIAARKRRKRGVIKKIYYWTLDDPDSMARILVTKLDGIIVNDPLKLLKVLEKEEFRHTYRLATRDDNPFTVI
jgi:PLAT/LH2 domain